MSSTLDAKSKQLIESKNFAQVGSIRPDGTPQVNPVWVDHDGDTIVLNSAEGRAWPRNVRENPKVEIVVQNMENPYEYVQIRGTVAEDTHEGADEHIDQMARKYLGEETYPFRQEGEQRVIFRIRPEQVKVWGG